MLPQPNGDDRSVRLPANHPTVLVALTILSFLGPFVSARTQTLSPGFHVVPRQLIRDLLENEDTDGDRKITVHDPYVRGTDRGDKVFWFTSCDGTRCEVAGCPCAIFHPAQNTLAIPQSSVVLKHHERNTRSNSFSIICPLRSALRNRRRHRTALRRCRSGADDGISC